MAIKSRLLSHADICDLANGFLPVHFPEHDYVRPSHRFHDFIDFTSHLQLIRIGPWNSTYQILD